jgi:hypothetical protein
MPKSTRFIAYSGGAALVIAIMAAVWYLTAWEPGPAWEALKSRVLPESASHRSPEASAPSNEAAAPPPKARKGGPAARGEPGAGTAPAADVTAAPAAVSAAASSGRTGSVPVTGPESYRPRRNLYLPGQRNEWTSSDMIVAAPMRLRAGGLVSVGADQSGPAGLPASTYERGLVRRRASLDTDARVLPSAPYLALIGRVCSGQGCSAPFLIGSGTLVCPADLELTGDLQIWTNNYVRVDGAQTVTRFSGTSGGFWMYAETAPADACGVRASRSAIGETPTTAAILRKPEFSVSSSQTSWKPFFLPMGEPLLIRASGEMQPTGSASTTGPDGMVVPDVPVWVYPGTTDVIVDSARKLFSGGLPYQALIGRVCGVKDCGPTFLVGREHLICPQPEYDDHLELWINHIIGPSGLLGSGTPLTLDTLGSEARRGVYRFEVASAPAGCGR